MNQTWAATFDNETGHIQFERLGEVLLIYPKMAPLEWYIEYIDPEGKSTTLETTQTRVQTRVEALDWVVSEIEQRMHEPLTK